MSVNFSSVSQTNGVSGHYLFAGIPEQSHSTFMELRNFCKDNSTQVCASLPWVAAEIAGNDGHATMLSFIHQWSGIRIYVSKDRAQFIQKVGFDVGEATHSRLLSDAMAGSQIDVPSAWGVFMALRRVAITAALKSRLPHDEISRRFGVTMRSLR